MQATPWNRKALLCAFEKAPPLLLPAAVFLFDVALFGASSALVVLADSLALKLVGMLLVTAAIVRLFLIGHDACHGSYTASPRLNSIFGRIAFLPSMTAFSLWEVGHNTAHHGFNNLKGRDQVWAPFSKAEYDGLPKYRQALERLYRSGLGWGAYYLVELWWKKLFFATRREIGSSRREYKLDSLLNAAGAVAWVGGIAIAARSTGQSVMMLEALAVVVPFLMWNAIMGFVVYVHHTNPQIAWFQNRQEWQRCRAYLTSTACVRFPFRLDRLMHNIMEHNAHHVSPRIPMFTLRAAQKALREKFPELCDYRLNLKSYRDIARRCKLYDYTNHAWLDFSGRITARVTMTVAAA